MPLSEHDEARREDLHELVGKIATWNQTQLESPGMLAEFGGDLDLCFVYSTLMWLYGEFQKGHGSDFDQAVRVLDLHICP